MPVSTFPDWLQAFAKINPVTVTANAARALRHPGIAGSRRGLDRRPAGRLHPAVRMALPADQLSRVPPPEDPHHVPVESPATDGQADRTRTGRSARGQASHRRCCRSCRIGNNAQANYNIPLVRLRPRESAIVFRNTRAHRPRWRSSRVGNDCGTEWLRSTFERTGRRRRPGWLGGGALRGNESAGFRDGAVSVCRVT